MNQIDKILEVAAKEIGTYEESKYSHNVKYNTAYYGGKVHNKYLNWCVVFLWWCFREANLSQLFFNGLKTASCNTLYNFMRLNTPCAYNGNNEVRRGDIVFYKFEKKTLDHVGIVEKIEGDIIVVIEGNTSEINEKRGVDRKKRRRSLIVCGYHPAYKIEMEEKELICKTMKDVPDWAKESVQKFIDRGYVNVVNGEFSIYESNLQMMVIIDRMMAQNNKW